MERILGMLSGIAVGILLVIIIFKVTKTDGKMKCRYDERQEWVNGKSYKISFFIMMIYTAVYGILTVLEIKVPADNFVVMMLGISIAVAAQIIYRVQNESYISLNEKPIRLVVMFILLGLGNIVVGIANIIHGEVFVDGVLTFRSTNLIVGILCGLVSTIVLVKHIKAAKEEE